MTKKIHLIFICFLSVSWSFFASASCREKVLQITYPGNISNVNFANIATGSNDYTFSNLKVTTNGAWTTVYNPTPGAKFAIPIKLQSNFGCSSHMAFDALMCGYDANQNQWLCYQINFDDPSSGNPSLTLSYTADAEKWSGNSIQLAYNINLQESGDYFRYLDFYSKKMVFHAKNFPAGKFYPIYIKGNSTPIATLTKDASATIYPTNAVEIPRDIEGTDDLGRAIIYLSNQCQLLSNGPMQDGSMLRTGRHLGVTYKDHFPGRITNENGNSCQIDIDYNLAWKKLNANVRYLADVPNHPSCAFYRVDVDPEDAPYDPNNRNGFYFYLNTTNVTKECDDPLYVSNTSLNTHYFYPNNGVIFDPIKGSVTPLKQSVTLELPKATAENPVEITLAQGLYDVSTISSDKPMSRSVGRAFSTKLPMQPPIDSALIKQCLGNLGESVFASVSVDTVDKLVTPVSYFQNGTFATPVSVKLKLDTTAIPRKGHVCSPLYDNIAFFVYDDNGNEKLITNNMYSNTGGASETPIAVLPADVVETDGIHKIPKYTYSTSESTKSDPTKETFAKFYLYLPQNEESLNLNIDAAYLANGMGNVYFKTPSQFNITGMNDEVAHPDLISSSTKFPHTFEFSSSNSQFTGDRKNIINPSALRLDYVSGVRKSTTNDRVFGIFYSPFGAVLSNCEDTPSAAIPALIKTSGIIDDVSLFCRIPMIGYAGYNANINSSDPVDTQSHFIGQLAFNDAYYIKDKDYPPEIRDANILRVFDYTGTLIRKKLDDVSYRMQSEETDQKANETAVENKKSLESLEYKPFNVRYMVTNQNQVPLYLWQEGRTEIKDTNLGEGTLPIKGNKQALYLSPDGQLELKVIPDVTQHASDINVAGTLNPNLVKDFSFKFDFFYTPQHYFINLNNYISASPTDFTRIDEATKGGAEPKNDISYDQQLIFTQIGHPTTVHDPGLARFRVLDKNNTYPGEHN